MYRQHFGLRHAPLGKDDIELWDDGVLKAVAERFQWLLQSPGVGLLTGEPGVGKTAALRHLTRNLNPHRYQVIYQPETDFGRVDLYRGLARALGVEPTRVQRAPCKGGAFPVGANPTRQPCSCRKQPEQSWR